jgi:DNA-binding NtrC family response regulator
MRDYERNIVAQTILRNGGNRDLAANALGITRRALDKILERHHMLIRRRFTRALPITKVTPSDDEEKNRE